MLLLLLRVLSYNRLLNLVKVYSSFLFTKLLKIPFVWGYPITLKIEPTTFCNFQCPECPTGEGSLKRKGGMLKFSDFTKIIDDICEHTFYLQLFFQGEPFLNKDLLRMISYAHAKRMFVSISTNGSVIPFDINTSRDSFPDLLIFSIDGLTQEIYSKYRIGGDLKKVMSNLEKVIELKKTKKMRRPFIEVQMLINKYNESEMSDMAEYCKRIKVDRLTYKTMQIYHESGLKEFLPNNEKYSRYKNSQEKSKIIVKGQRNTACFLLWSTAVVGFSGDYAICCFDKNISFNIGNALDSNLNSIWFSKKMMAIRSQVMKAEGRFYICENCSEGVKTSFYD